MFILSSYVEENVIKKIQIWTLCLWLVSRHPKSGCFFEKFTVKQVFKSFPGRNNSLEPPVFGFVTVFHMIWKNQYSWEPWLVGFQVYRHSKNLCVLLSCHYGFNNYFDILIFLFSNTPGGVPTCWMLSF